MSFNWFQPRRWFVRCVSICVTSFWWVFSHTPLISGLRLATLRSLNFALKELFFFWILSSLPIIFAVVVDVASRDSFPALKEIFAITGSKIRWGEIFVYINALTAPGLYLLFKFVRDTKNFPNAYGILLWSIITLLISAVLYSRGTPTRVTVQLAIALYVAALVLRYLALVYDLLRVDFPEEGRKEEAALVERMEGFQGT